MEQEQEQVPLIKELREMSLKAAAKGLVEEYNKHASRELCPGTLQEWVDVLAKHNYVFSGKDGRIQYRIIDEVTGSPVMHIGGNEIKFASHLFAIMVLQELAEQKVYSHAQLVMVLGH